MEQDSTKNEPVQINVQIQEAEKKGPKELPFWKSASFWKWFLGTFLIGALGLMAKVTYQKQQIFLSEKELNLKAFETASEVYTNLDESGNDDIKKTLEAEVNYLEFTKAFLSTTEYRASIDSAIKSFKIKIDTLNIKIAAIANKSKEETKKSDLDSASASKTIGLANSPELKKELVKIDAESDSKNWVHEDNNNFKPITDFNKVNVLFIDKIEKDKKIDMDSLIRKPVLFMTKPVTNPNSDFSLVGQPEQSWFKEGYFVEFGKTLRVGLNQLNRGNQNFINIRLTQINTKEKDPQPFNKSLTINQGSSVTVDYEGYHYIISFDYIGSAGKNPFSKAAYITVTTYQKKPDQAPLNIKQSG